MSINLLSFLDHAPDDGAGGVLLSHTHPHLPGLPLRRRPQQRMEDRVTEVAVLPPLA